jgi:hypothetical protein
LGIASQLPQTHSTELEVIALQAETGWFRVPDFLIQPICNGITKLDYSWGGKKLTLAQLKQLISYLTHDHFVTDLDINDNELGKGDAQALAEALKTNTTLTTLNLGWNQLGKAGAQALAEALKTNTSLTRLDLGDNQLGEAGAQALAEVLKINSTLTALGLGDDRLGDAGAQAFAEALKTNSTLTTLDLRGNQLGDAGAQALAEALKTNSTLTTLDLEYNRIGDAGAQALAEVLKINTSLTTLDLEYNKLDGAGAQALAEALKTNTSLTTLILGGNQLDDDAGKAKVAEREIVKYLARNRELQKTAKSASQPKDSKSSQPPLPLPDKKETKSALKTPAVEPVAPHAQFFLPSAPVDEKAQTLLSKARTALDRAYPPSMIEHSATRQAYSAQLMEYQSRLGVLGKAERDTLRQLVITLEEVAAQRDYLAQSSSTTTFG